MVDAVLGILAGFVSGVMSGAFGVGGAILTTPAVRVLLDAPPLVAVGTPLPAIFPTTVAGARAYRRAGLVDGRAVRWLAPPGVAAAALGAILTKIINAHVLLLATAALIEWQAVNVGMGRTRQDQGEGAIRLDLRLLGLPDLELGLLQVGPHGQDDGLLDLGPCDRDVDAPDRTADGARLTAERRLVEGRGRDVPPTLDG